MELTRSGGPGDRPPIDPEQQRQQELQRELERQREQELHRPALVAQLNEHIQQRPDLAEYLKQFKPEQQDKLKEAVVDSVARFAPAPITYVQVGQNDGRLYTAAGKRFLGIADPAKALDISEEERFSLSRPKSLQQETPAEPDTRQRQITPQQRQPEREQRDDSRQSLPIGQSEPARYNGPLNLSQRQQQESQNLPLDASQVAEPKFEQGILHVQPIPYSNPSGPQPISHEPQQRQTDIQQQLEPKLGKALEGYNPTEQTQLKQALTTEISDIAGNRLQIDHVEKLDDGRLAASLNRGLQQIHLDPQQVLQSAPQREALPTQEPLSAAEQQRQQSQQHIQQQVEQLTQHQPFERLAIENRLREAVGDERIESMRIEGEDTIQLGLRNGMVMAASSHELLNMDSGRELLQRARTDPATQSNQSAEAGHLFVDPSLKDRPLGEPIAVLAQANTGLGQDRGLTNLLGIHHQPVKNLVALDRSILLKPTQSTASQHSHHSQTKQVSAASSGSTQQTLQTAIGTVNDGIGDWVLA